MTNSDYKSKFDKEGYLLIDQLFDANQVTTFNDEIDRISDMDGPEFFREEGSTTIRTIFSPDKFSQEINQLIHSDVLYQIISDLLGEPYYLFQSKFNDKQSLKSGTWPWHQDFKFWKDDGMPRDQAVTVAVYLTDVTPFSGPILCVPGSHKGGEIKTRFNNPDGVHSEDLKYMIDRSTLREVVEKYGVIRSTPGKAGSALIFHSSLLHSSFQNMHYDHRRLLMFTYNPISNKTEKVDNPRPDYMVRRDFTSIEPNSIKTVDY